VRILITTVQVPFIRGGAEALAEGLRDALRSEGHEAEIVAIPFKWYPPERILDHMLACRLLDITESTGMTIDRVIGLKFPAYFIPHPNKVLWIVHQHRTAYNLWDDHALSDLIRFPNGSQVRGAIREADARLLREAKKIFAISRNVSHRLKQYCGIDSTPLYNPPQHAARFYHAAAEDYFFFPSRITPPKRQLLVLEALAETRKSVRVRFAGHVDNPSYGEALKAHAKSLKVHDRVEWLGPLSEEEKRRQYASALGVVFPPINEDYGYVTLEAMLSSKPVITCVDSGGPLEFVRTNETGLVTESTSRALAAAMDALWENRAQAQAMGQAGRADYDRQKISWQEVIRRLLS
jgi:glycosyltransferase involved in cell wall biosynthesis